MNQLLSPTMIERSALGRENGFPKDLFSQIIATEGEEEVEFREEYAIVNEDQEYKLSFMRRKRDPVVKESRTQTAST